MPQITAIVHTYNAERFIGLCLSALKGFDEILVIDMESTDRTQEIVREFGARLVVVERGEHRIVEAYRDFAIKTARYDWVLIIDADEIVPDALREYLYKAIEENPEPRAILIPIKNFYMNQWMRCYYPDYILRFFNRKGAYWPYEIHSRPSHVGPEERIPRDRDDLAFIHLANETVEQTIGKMNSYTNREAIRRAPKYRRWQLFVTPAFRFFKSYILKRGFRDGMPGFIHAVNDAMYRFTLLSKIEEQKQLTKSPAPELKPYTYHKPRK
jgi:glycosyltransferase involved in cell wall biosynthesis